MRHNLKVVSDLRSDWIIGCFQIERGPELVLSRWAMVLLEQVATLIGVPC